MPEFTLQDAIDWSGGIPAGGSPSAGPLLLLRGVSCDSRHVAEGSLFVALRGPRHDGHRFLADAAAAGAGALLIDDLSALEALRTQCGAAAPPAVLTGDTLRALQNLAAGYRATLPGRVIGITGSVGKTSTRQMVSACLGAGLSVHQSAGNLNNEIGLPQTLLQAEPSHQVIVLEMAMRGPGEIRLLSRIAQPDLAMITLIGTSHIGRLGSREAILAAKAEILDGLRPGGLLILNAADPYLRQLGAALGGRFRLAYVSAAGAKRAGIEEIDLAAADSWLHTGPVRVSPEATRFTVHVQGGSRKARTIKVSLPFPGEHHALNTLFGLAAAEELGVSLEAAAAAAASCPITQSRQRIVRAGRVTILDDSYNASPESMLAALKVLSALACRGKRTAAALGGMLELGDYAAAAHRETGAQAARLGVSRLFVIGPQAADIAAGARAVNPDLAVSLHENNGDLARAALDWLKPGDSLLIKGSRVFAMEQVTQALATALGPPRSRSRGSEMEEAR